MSHTVVNLLVARAKSHPEEFEGAFFRWEAILNQLEPYLNTEERRELNKVIGPIRKDSMAKEVATMIVLGGAKK